MTFDEADREFMMEELNITEMTLELFKSFSVQYKGNPSYPLNKKDEEKLNTSNKKVKKSTKKDKKTET